ncbi:hypothetical protein SEA_KUWABARA_42 [Gordonia phage Kuwabara]|nr:hypothetical protein SEA_KUWABARA_42 [Gordonia phage Kuwabara]
MDERDYRWQKTNAADEGWRQLESIPAPALVVDAMGVEFFKASTNPAEEQYFDVTNMDDPRHMSPVWQTKAPFDYLAEPSDA